MNRPVAIVPSRLALLARPRKYRSWPVNSTAKFQQIVVERPQELDDEERAETALDEVRGIGPRDMGGNVPVLGVVRGYRKRHRAKRIPM